MNPALPSSRIHTRRAALAITVVGGLAVALSAGPSAAATGFRAAVANGVLDVAGGPSAERIALRLVAGDPTQLEVLVNGERAGSAFGVDTFRAISVDAGNGDDEVVIDDRNGAFTTTRATRIAGGNGDDTLLGGSGAETFDGGRGNDVVDGNGGSDMAFLGRGDDTFIWDPGDASDVVEGGSGSDTMVFNGSSGNEIMAATASGGRVLFTRNLGGIVMNLNDIETIDVRALGGADSITVGDATGTDLARVNVDLAASVGGTTADQAADTVKVVGTAVADTISATTNGGVVSVNGLQAKVTIRHADPALDRLVIDTAGGNDAVTIEPNLQDVILLTVL